MGYSRRTHTTTPTRVFPLWFKGGLVNGKFAELELSKFIKNAVIARWLPDQGGLSAGFDCLVQKNERPVFIHCLKLTDEFKRAKHYHDHSIFISTHSIFIGCGGLESSTAV